MTRTSLLLDNKRRSKSFVRWLRSSATRSHGSKRTRPIPPSRHPRILSIPRRPERKRRSERSAVLIDILGEDFGGVVVCDYYSANKKFIHDNKILVQYCWAHLIRDIKFLTTLSYKAIQRWAKALLTILRKLFELWKTRYLRHPGRYQRTIEKWRKAFLQKVRKPPNHNEAWNIRDRFKGSNEKGYFLFLGREGVPPTNNGTEQAIRFVVIDRRVTQGTRSHAGMRFCERAWTVVATSARHKRSVYQSILPRCPQRHLHRHDISQTHPRKSVKGYTPLRIHQSKC